MKKIIPGIFIAVLSFISCDQVNQPAELVVPVRPEPKTLAYQTDSAGRWLAEHASNPGHLRIALAVNRTDSVHFAKMDSVIVPVDLSGDLVFYLPFPLMVSSLRDVQKIIFFSYPTQTFATYENGILTYTGPTNMGSKQHLTPTGLFSTNWKAEQTISTFDDEWELFWNFNIQNKEGVGWHQYALPGYPASHSCLRLLEADAKHLYTWADQWELKDDETVLVKGTPVIVFGQYPFDAPKPWLQLLADPHALDITEAQIEALAKPHLNSILTEQKKRIAMQEKTK